MSRTSGPFHLYVLTCLVNGKKYVGITTQNNPRHRLVQHKHDARRGARTPLHHAIRKYGIGAFDFEIVKRANSWHDLCELESEYIQQLGTLSIDGNGYNLTNGGEGAFGASRSQATRKKLSRIVSKYYEDNPAAREHNRRVSRELMKDPVRRKKSREGARKAWQRPEYRKHRIAQIKKQVNQPEALEANRRRALKQMADPKNREHLRKMAKKQMSDSSNRELSRQGALEQWKNPEYQDMMKEKMRRVAKNQWQDPDYRRRMRTVNSRPVVAAGEKYPSLNSAAEALGVKANTICSRLKNDRNPDYYYLPRSEVIRIHGVDYESISAAARAIGKSYGIVYRRIKDSDNTDYQCIQLEDE